MPSCAPPKLTEEDAANALDAVTVGAIESILFRETLGEEACYRQDGLVRVGC